MKEFYNERYSAEAYAYGELPNEYFKAKLDTLTPGKLLLPAEGEGRNAVYAASKGWDVTAIDQSEAGHEKAMRLAAKHGVTIKYQVMSLMDCCVEPEEFDAVALIYAHFPPTVRYPWHSAFERGVRKGGHIILEAFSKDQLAYSARNPQSGGPRDLDMLYDLDTLKHDFKCVDMLELEQVETTLSEGLYHVGEASVVRMLGLKL